MARSVTPRHFIDRLDGLSPRGTWAVLAFAYLAFMAFDMTSPEVGTGPLYIPLIALAGWRLGPREACGVALVAALLKILPIHGVDAGLPPLAAAVRGMVRLGTYAIVVTAVYGLRRVYVRERYAARHDGLTGVLNRSSFEAYAQASLGTCAADGPVTVLAVADIDGFKSVNDTSGHAEGDEVLRRFASAGSAAIGQGDRFGRLGGDEFVLPLQASTVAAVVSGAETIHRRLSDGLRGSGHPVGISMGALVVRPGTTLDWATAIREADRLMYISKHARMGGFSIETFGGSAVPAFSTAGAGKTPLAAA